MLWIDHLLRRINAVAAWLNILLIGVIALQVVLRHFLGGGDVAVEELMWHLFAAAFLLGIAGAIAADDEVRVDILRDAWSARLRAAVELFGIVLLLLPTLVILLDHSIDWVIESWQLDEGSDSPGGLGNRWLIKSMLPIACALMLLAAISRAIRYARQLLNRSGAPDSGPIDG